MKKIVLLVICTFLCFGMHAQSVIGAWEAYHTSESSEKLKSVVIFSEGYQVLTIHNATTGKFIHTNGGTWKLEGDIMTEKAEFHSDDPERVGKETSFKVVVSETTLEIIGNKTLFKRIDDGTPGKLQGAWLMSGRMVDGNIQPRKTNTPRKTMKILSGTRFQWIAYNTETKQFSGTGGGNYTTENGKYTENIEFFSRDDTRVGASLEFNYNLIDGNWHHSGLSSTGNPIHEVWSLRE